MKQAGISGWWAACLVGAMAGLSACAPPKALQPDSPGPQIGGSGSCQADKVAWAVGQTSNEQVFARVWKESGAGLIRPIAPGQAVTRDFKPDRLNVRLDANNVITGVDCG